MIQTRISFVTILFITFIAIFSTGCSGGGGEEVETVEVRVPVTSSNPTSGTVTKYYETTGTVYAGEDSFLGFPDGGRIVKMLVDRGDRVSIGDLLAEVDARSYRETVNIATASRSAALDAVSAQQSMLEVSKNQLSDTRVRFEKIEADYNRYVGLYEDEVITRKEFEDMETAYKSAKLAVASAKESVQANGLQVEITQGQAKAAEASVDQALKALSDTKLTAPFSGVISEKLLDIGANPGSGESVLRLTGDDARKLVLSIPEEFYSLVDVGDTVDVRVSHLGGETIPLEVTVITDDVSIESRTFYVELALPEDLDVLPGAFCKANMVLERIENAMTIPEAALLSFEDQRGVYVNEGGVAHKKIVEVGIQEGEIVQILSGLDWDDQVVVVGNRFLNEDAKLEDSSPEGDSYESESTGLLETS